MHIGPLRDAVVLVTECWKASLKRPYESSMMKYYDNTWSSISKNHRQPLSERVWSTNTTVMSSQHWKNLTKKKKKNSWRTPARPSEHRVYIKIYTRHTDQYQGVKRRDNWNEQKAFASMIGALNAVVFGFSLYSQHTGGGVCFRFLKNNQICQENHGFDMENNSGRIQVTQIQQKGKKKKQLWSIREIWRLRTVMKRREKSDIFQSKDIFESEK